MFNHNIKNITEELQVRTYFTTFFKRITERLNLIEDVDYKIVYPFNGAKFYNATVYVNDETKYKIYKLYNKEYLLNNNNNSNNRINNNLLQEIRHNDIEQYRINNYVEEQIEDNKNKIKIKELTKENRVLLDTIKEQEEFIKTMNDSIISRNELNKINNNNYHLEINNDDSYITPVICLADIHYGQVVKKSYVFGYNEYNSEICKNRLHDCVNKFINHYKYMQNYNIKEIIIYMGGDDIANNMHNQPIDRTVPEMVIEISKIYIQLLNKIKDNFKGVKLNIIFVSSNHNRINAEYEYTPNFNCITNSYTFLIMNNLINAGFELLWDDSGSYFMNVNGKRILFEHGHNFKINPGNHNSIINSLNKKNKQFLSLERNEIDLILLCHYHSPIITDKVIICCSLVGIDNYSKSLNLPAFKPGITTFSITDKGELVNYKIITTDI